MIRRSRSTGLRMATSAALAFWFFAAPLAAQEASGLIAQLQALNARLDEQNAELRARLDEQQTRIDAISQRKFQCRGVFQSDLSGKPRQDQTAFCDASEVAVACLISPVGRSQHYTRESFRPPNGCWDPDIPSDWITAICCSWR